MKEKELIELLEKVKAGETAPEAAARLLHQGSYEDLGYAKVDHHRAARQGAAEVIFGQGKTAEQIEGIVRSMEDRGSRNIIITRLAEEKEALLRGKISYRYSAAARLAVAAPAERPLTGDIAVVSAGTSDLAVCEEAALTAEALGSRVHRVYDAGVAGLHRLLGSLETLEKARCIIAVAGMEGALPSVVGGLVSCPVIAVPTSVGYGANLGGLAALLAMLNSCASGVSVVNIDNGFGAGFLAHRINQMRGIEE
ncbi:MAG: nickel pincer cofactor biosynthesis protein LarB [Oscillospiraceae bacterium]|nr:nickel pincer cofactor biosynthesis protein LarB [Oscillospiraceae bacterium]